jgi:hypothetical protein
MPSQSDIGGLPDDYDAAASNKVVLPEAGQGHRRGSRLRNLCSQISLAPRKFGADSGLRPGQIKASKNSPEPEQKIGRPPEVEPNARVIWELEDGCCVCQNGGAGDCRINQGKHYMRVCNRHFSLFPTGGT